MIGSLNGRLARKDSSRILIEVGGVGYLVQIPLSTFFSLGEVGSEVRLLVHTHVREDALQLFGFGSELELAVFGRLIDVSGIGPKMAANVLSGIPASDLVQAIRAEDTRRLATVPGIGKRTAERLVVELKGRLDDLSVPVATERPPSPGDSLREDAVSALVNLGYRSRDAEAAVDRVRSGDEQGLETVLKAALATLAR